MSIIPTIMEAKKQARATGRTVRVLEYENRSIVGDSLSELSINLFPSDVSTAPVIWSVLRDGNILRYDYNEHVWFLYNDALERIPFPMPIFN